MIKKYNVTNGGYQYCAGCYQMEQSEYGDYVLVEDIESRLRLMLETSYTGVDLIEAVEELIEELK